MELILLVLIILGLPLIDKIGANPGLWPWMALIATVIVGGRLLKQHLDHKQARELKRLELTHKQAVMDNTTLQAELKRPTVRVQQAPAPQKAEEHNL